MLGKSSNFWNPPKSSKTFCWFVWKIGHPTESFFFSEPFFKCESHCFLQHLCVINCIYIYDTYVCARDRWGFYFIPIYISISLCVSTFLIPYPARDSPHTHTHTLEHSSHHLHMYIYIYVHIQEVISYIKVHTDAHTHT